MCLDHSDWFLMKVVWSEEKGWLAGYLGICRYFD